MKKDYKPVNWKEPSTWGMIAIALLVAVGIPWVIVSGKKERTDATKIPDPLCLSAKGNVKPLVILYGDPECKTALYRIVGDAHVSRKAVIIDVLFNGDTTQKFGIQQMQIDEAEAEDKLFVRTDDRALIYHQQNDK